MLERGGYDGCVGLDVKAMRTDQHGRPDEAPGQQPAMFLRLLDVVRGVDAGKVEAYRAERDYEGLEMYILEKLMGK